MLYRWIEDFISIKEENPGGAGSVMTKEPVAFFWEAAIPNEIDNLNTMATSNVCSAICACGINDNYTVGKISTDSLKANTQVTFLISNRNSDRKIRELQRHLLKFTVR